MNEAPQTAAAPPARGRDASAGGGPQKRRTWGPPWLHFLMGGALLFVGVRLWPSSPESLEVRIPAHRVQMLKDDFARLHGRSASDAQLDALIDDLVVEELLYREAIRRGLDRGDPSVRARVIQKMLFVTDNPERSSEELHREGLELGFHRDDIVIRRLLAQKMRLIAGLVGSQKLPNEQELETYLANRRDHYEQPARITLAQIFLSRERRGATLATDANQLLAELVASGLGPEAATERGDAFSLGARHSARSRAQLEAMFGTEFIAALEKLPEGRWSGPVPSAYGLHLVWIERREAPSVPDLDSVRNRVSGRIVAEQRNRRIEEFVEELRRRYHVEVQKTGS